MGKITLSTTTKIYHNKEEYKNKQINIKILRQLQSQESQHGKNHFIQNHQDLSQQRGSTVSVGSADATITTLNEDIQEMRQDMQKLQQDNRNQRTELSTLKTRMTKEETRTTTIETQNEGISNRQQQMESRLTEQNDRMMELSDNQTNLATTNQNTTNARFDHLATMMEALVQNTQQTIGTQPNKYNGGLQMIAGSNSQLTNSGNILPSPPKRKAITTTQLNQQTERGLSSSPAKQKQRHDNTQIVHGMSDFNPISSTENEQTMEQQPTAPTQQVYEQEYDWDESSGAEEERHNNERHNNNQVASRSGDIGPRLLFATRDSQSAGMLSEEERSFTGHNFTANTNNEEEIRRNRVRKV